jgi:hypothetical protein
MLPPKDREKTQTKAMCDTKQESDNGKGIIAGHDQTEEEEIAQNQKTKNARSLARQETLENRRH